MTKNHIKSEFLKVIYNKWLCLDIVILVVFTPIMCIFLTSNSKVMDINYYSNKFLLSLYFAQIWFVVFSVMYFGEEYNKSTLRTSVLSTGNRMKLLITKQICLIICISIFFIIISIITIIVLNFYYSQNIFIDLIKQTWPAYISTIGICLISSSLTVILKSPVIPLSIFISGILGLSSLLVQYWKISYYFPISATMNCFYFIKNPGYLSIDKGLICEGIWSFAFLIFSGIIFKNRSIK